MLWEYIISLKLRIHGTISQMYLPIVGSYLLIKSNCLSPISLYLFVSVALGNIVFKMQFFVANLRKQQFVHGKITSDSMETLG